MAVDRTAASSRSSSVERRHEIVQMALGVGKVRVNELAERFGVSDVTIRADLKRLHQRGILARTRGGAVASNRILRELSLIEKSENRTGIKSKLAAAACTLIAEGDTIILDSGSTIGEVARMLAPFRRLTVMTNGLNVAMSLAEHADVRLMMTGGTLRQKSQSFFGRPAEDTLLRYNFDKLFLGVDGIDFRVGITTHFEQEALLNQRMCEVAKEIIVVTDSSKFNQAGVHKICGLDDIDMLVTDTGIPDNFVSALEDKGVRLLIVEI